MKLRADMNPAEWLSWLRDHALFSCSIEACAEECSKHAEDLAIHPEKGLICDSCYDEDPELWIEDPNDPDGALSFYELPAFTPFTELEVAARMYMNYHSGDDE